MSTPRVRPLADLLRLFVGPGLVRALHGGLRRRGVDLHAAGIGHAP